MQRRSARSCGSPGRGQPQPQAPPQQPPPPPAAGGGAYAVAVPPRITDTAEKTREVSGWPWGQTAAVAGAVMSRRTSNDTSQVRHRYS